MAEEKYDVIEGIAADVIDELQDQGLTQAVCGDLEKHAYSVNDGIEDADLPQPAYPGGIIMRRRGTYMKIHGLQKMTLLDFPGKVACTVFLGGCDFRCPFCHNFELVDGTAKPVMEEEELLAFLKKRQGLLDGVAITGGEPCLQKELPELLKKIRDLGYAVKLDTNGFHPDLLEEILEEGLVDYVAMDIKNSPRNMPRPAALEGAGPAPLRESIALLMEGRPRLRVPHHGGGPASTGGGFRGDRRG